MGGGPERAHPPNDRCAARPGVVARRLVALLGAGRRSACRVAGDRVFTMERGGRREQFTLVVRSASLPRKRPASCSTRRRSLPTAPQPSTGSSPRGDGCLVVYGRRRAATSAAPCGCSTSSPASTSTTRSPTPGPRPWPGCPTPRGSCTPVTRSGDDYHRMVYAHTLGQPWPQDDPLVWGELPNAGSVARRWLSPDGRHGLVPVSVGWGRVDVHLWDREADTWLVVVDGHEAISSFVVVGDRLIGTTTLGAPRTAELSTPSPRIRRLRPMGTTLVARG